MFLDQFAIDNRCDAGGQTVHDETWRKGLAGRENECLVIGCNDVLVDVFSSDAKLAQNKCRALVELDCALERIGGIMRRNRVAGGKF